MKKYKILDELFRRSIHHLDEESIRIRQMSDWELKEELEKLDKNTTHEIQELSNIYNYGKK